MERNFKKEYKKKLQAGAFGNRPGPEAPPLTPAKAA